MERVAGSAKFPIGSALPAFSLPNVDGNVITDSYFDGAKLALVVFACNHCPYVIGSERMLFDTVREFRGRGLSAVVISSNDAAQYPEDSFEKMKEKAVRDKMPCPYLYDESQSVARAFDAECTPECFLFDASKKLIFHGAVNNSPRNPDQANANFLEAAIVQALGGRKPDPAFAHPIGCSIKWKA